MKFFLYLFLINFLLLNIIKSLIVLPLYHLPKKENISSSYELINNYMPNNLYSLIKVGNPPQNLELIITEDDLVFSIKKQNCLLKNSFYDNTNSKSFKNITKEKNTPSKFYGCSESEDSFLFNQDINSPNDFITVNNLGFILENSPKQTYGDYTKYNCAILSLNLCRYNIANNDYNLIMELKKLGIIYNHIWTIKYINNNLNPEKNLNNLEGYLIIGDYPHIYEKEKYNSLNLRSSLNNMNEKGWNLQFRNITINNTEILTHYMTGIFSFDNNYILGTEEYKSKIASLFFRQYTQKGICFDDGTNSHYFIYYCKKGENFNEKNINSFPSLNFFHVEFNFTFQLTGNDLFLEKNNFYFFLIIFDRYDYKSWKFGKLFLNKYQFIFDHVSKKINFYINQNDNNNNEDGGGVQKEKNVYIKNTTLLIIIFSSIAVISFIVGLIIGKKKFGNKKRNNIANELENEDNNENNNYLIKKQEKEKSITDSEDVTNISEEGIN